MRDRRPNFSSAKNAARRAGAPIAPGASAPGSKNPAASHAAANGNADAETIACPFCGEAILRIAKKCKYCQSFIVGGKKPQGKLNLVGRLRKRSSGDGRMSIIFGLIGLVPICTAPIFGILAIMYGVGARKNAPERASGTIGLMLGVIDLLLLAFYTILVFVLKLHGR